MLSRCIKLTQTHQKSFITSSVLPLGLFRSYHSTEHIGSNAILNQSTIESKIFNTSIKYIPEFGFNSQCITKAIQELKYPDSLNSIISFNQTGSPELQLILYWLKLQRINLESYVDKNQKSLLSMNNDYERLRHLIKIRLLYNEPIIKKLSLGISQLIIPYNLTNGLEEIQALSDDLAFYSGDNSHDFSWYSKRFTIGGIYISSELFMLNDTSKGFENTLKFVDNKIDEFSNLSNGYNDVEQWVGFNAISLINLIKSQLTRG